MKEVSDDVENEFGKGRSRPFRKEVKDYEDKPRKSGVVQRKPDIEAEDLDELEGRLSSSLLAKIR